MLARTVTQLRITYSCALFLIVDIILLSKSLHTRLYTITSNLNFCTLLYNSQMFSVLHAVTLSEVVRICVTASLGKSRNRRAKTCADISVLVYHSKISVEKIPCYYRVVKCRKLLILGRKSWYVHKLHGLRIRIIYVVLANY